MIVSMMRWKLWRNTSFKVNLFVHHLESNRAKALNVSLDALKANISIMAISNESQEVIGILINSILKKSNAYDTVYIEDEPLKALHLALCILLVLSKLAL